MPLKRRALDRPGVARALLLLAAALLFPAPTAPLARAQAPGNLEGIHSGPRAKRDQEIHWRPWGAAAFAEAKREGKLVLLDLTAVWCHWCHVMDETTYSDPAVIQALNARFIPIRVDADRYPQVADRYLTSGWPTTAVLTPQGHVLATQTYLLPAEFRRMISEVEDFYRRKRGDVDRKGAEMDRAVQETWKSEPPDTAGTAALGTQIGRTVDELRREEDRKNGGFRSAPKFHNPDAVAFLFREARLRRDREIRAVALRAVDGAMRLEDSVWGGYFRYGTKPDWSAPHYEKLLSGNADMLGSLALAYRETGARKYSDAVSRTVDYVNRWLGAAPEAGGSPGGWFGSQDADVGSHDPRATFYAGEDYYVLGDRARRSEGLPHVDSTIYVDANARMVSALIEANRARALSPDREPAREKLAMDRIWREARSPDGSLYHALTPHGRVSPGLLRDQALAGLAYVDLYEATGDTIQLGRARVLRDWLRAHLEDRVGGGFRHGVPDSDAVGRARAGERTEEGSVLAATLYLRLYWLDEPPADRETVDRTLLWLRSGSAGPLDPATALLAERAAAKPVRIAVVGAGDRGKASPFLAAAYRTDAPEIVVRLYEEGGPRARWGKVSFPAKPAPALYVCGERACSPPMTDPGTLERRIRDFLAAGLR